MQITLNSITHRFGEMTALDDITIEGRDGEILAIIGPSGCGKSTLLGIAGGLLAPTSGEVLLSGSPPADTLNEITFVFQDFALLPWQTVRKNVSFVLEHHGLSRDALRARVDDALARTGLSDFADALPRQLSGGMRQRAGIARALAVRPAIFLMDEPLSALDAQTRELLQEDILDLWQRDRPTILYVTHNLQEALQLASRVCVLSRRPGRVKEIVEIGIPQSERRAPEAQVELARLGEKLWGLIREEAIVADREIADA
ncbi:ABC transporter ATP-binding protein [Halodurantibacterium flavum]|uniref:ABC transporter ATP-binding protein n=1 Tax=Halodurantibacterium flavum TaxID=1382802 RepID=A0ABW4S1Z7_9RHOB